MLTPAQFKSSRGNLLGIVNSQIAIAQKADLGDRSALLSLTDARKNLKDDILHVLVMGMFSSGKSTFLNALMGEVLLPAKPIPTTAMIGEIVYSDNPEATLFPKKENPGEEVPINIYTKELEKYIVIDHTESNDDKVKKPNPFKKVLIKYPLEICKYDIMLVDSPGLNDPTCHDDITKNYLPKSDAIIYCMNSQVGFNKEDKTEIERLVSMGYKSMIFVCTYFDLLQNNDIMQGRNDAEETKRHLTRILSKYTDLGESGIFFVGSLPALMAKKTGNTDMLVSSGFHRMEKRLEEILFNEKGRMKLLKSLYSIRRVNRETGQYLTDLLEITNSDRTELAERIRIAENNLTQARVRANEISTQFKLSSQRLIQGAMDRGRLFFLNTIIPNIETWAEEFTPNDDQSISMWHPKRTGTAFTEGCIKFVQSQLETAMARWCQNELVPKYIEPQLEELTRQQDANLQAYEQDLKNVRTSLHLSIDSEEISNSENAGKTNRILSAIAGAFLNPASLVVGGAFGWKGLMSSLLTTLVGGVVLGIISLFTPVGWVGFIITYIVSALSAGIFVGTGIEKKIKKKIAEKMYEELSNKQEQIASEIGSSVAEIIDKIQKAVETGLNAPVMQFKKVLDEAQSAVTAKSETLVNKVATYTKLRNENNKLANDLDSFAECIGA